MDIELRNDRIPRNPFDRQFLDMTSLLMLCMHEISDWSSAFLHASQTHITICENAFKSEVATVPYSNLSLISQHTFNPYPEQDTELYLYKYVYL